MPGDVKERQLFLYYSH